MYHLDVSLIFSIRFDSPSQHKTHSREADRLPTRSRCNQKSSHYSLSHVWIESLSKIKTPKGDESQNPSFEVPSTMKDFQVIHQLYFGRCRASFFSCIQNAMAIVVHSVVLSPLGYQVPNPLVSWRVAFTKDFLEQIGRYTIEAYLGFGEGDGIQRFTNLVFFFIVPAYTRRLSKESC
jgi:hypothetical protein